MLYAMNKPKVFITRKWPASIEAKLKQHYDVSLNANTRHLVNAEILVHMKPTAHLINTARSDRKH